MPLTIPDQTIAAQVPEGPNAMTRISSLMDLQNKRNQITSGNIRNTSDQANLDEEQGVRSLMQNFDSYKGQDGNVDMNKFVPDVLKAAPTKGAAIISGVVNAQKDGTMAKQALGQLSQQQRGQIAQFVGSMAGNGKTPQENEQAFNDFGQNMPDAKPIVDFFHKHVMPGANASPEQANAAYLRAATSVMSPTEQVGANTQSGIMVTDGQQSQGINTAPLAPGGIGASIAGTQVSQKLPPSQLESIETDAAGNKKVVSRSPQGSILSTRDMPGSSTPGKPGGFVIMQPGQVADIGDAQKEVGGVRAAGDQVGVQANINQNILRLSRDTKTGPGTDAWKNALGRLPGVAFNDHQELGKYLEKQAISSMQSMGGAPSDARLDAAMKANGSTAYNPAALQDVTKFNDATTTALKAYREGVDKAVGLKNSDYTALPSFKALWSKNLDPNVFRVENAIRDNDTMELQKLKTELGVDGMKKLAQKRLNLTTLQQTGRLPQ